MTDADAQILGAVRTAVDYSNSSSGETGGGSTDAARRDSTLIKGVILTDDDAMYANARELAVRLTVRRTTNTPSYDERYVDEVRTNGAGTSTNPYRFELDRASLDRLEMDTIVERKGPAIEECIRFKQGERATLFAPLYLLLVPTEGSSIIAERVDESWVAEATGLAVATPTYEATKVEMITLLRDAANKTYGIDNMKRKRIHEYADSITANRQWSPSDLESTAARPLARSLMLKARELVSMQADQGKIWRNARTVDAIRTGARAVAASLCMALSV